MKKKLNIELFILQLSEHEREFFMRMDKLMKFEEVVVCYKENSVTYFPDTDLKQQPLILRYIVKNGELTVELKLNFIDCYTDLINTMPEHIKSLFRSIKNCDHVTDSSCGNKNCGIRRSYTLDSIHYYLCSYKYYFNIDIFNLDDIEYYIKIINAEIQAVKARKKHNTTIYE